MRNRAKCRSCQDIIEASHADGYVACRCGEISICEDAGQFRAHLKNKENFLLVDDEGNEIVPKIPRADTDISEASSYKKPTKKELLEMLDEMSKKLDDLPSSAALAPITHADFGSLIMLLSSIFRAD